MFCLSFEMFAYVLILQYTYYDGLLFPLSLIIIINLLFDL
jgi:hypothetical protein